MYVTFSVSSIKSLKPSSMKPRRAKKVVSQNPLAEASGFCDRAGEFCD